jgi:hypothetical protein
MFARKPNESNCAGTDCAFDEHRLLSMTVPAGSTNALRQLTARLCGDKLRFTRLKPCSHGKRMRVFLCLPAASVESVSAAVARFFPDVVFGQCRDVAFKPLNRKFRSPRTFPIPPAGRSAPRRQYAIQW